MSKRKIDPQLTGMAGEFLTVGKLFKRGYQASVTFGNAKAVDVLVYNPSSGKSFNVQVKTLRRKNCFPMRKETIDPRHIYVFVLLHDFEKEEEFFIVKGSEILNNVDNFFGSSYRKESGPSSMPAVNYGPLKQYKNNWELFEK